MSLTWGTLYVRDGKAEEDLDKTGKPAWIRLQKCNLFRAGFFTFLAIVRKPRQKGGSTKLSDHIAEDERITPIETERLHTFHDHPFRGDQR